MTHTWSGRFVLPTTEDRILKAFQEDMNKAKRSAPLGVRLTHGSVTPSTLKVKNQVRLDTTEAKNDLQFNKKKKYTDIGSTVPKPIKLSVVLDDLLTKAKKETIEHRSEKLFGPELSHEQVMKNYERYVKIRQKLTEEKKDKENIQNSVNNGDLLKTVHNLYDRAIRKCASTSIAIPGPGDKTMDLIKEEGFITPKKKKEKRNAKI
jgi:hypothetical protein